MPTPTVKKLNRLERDLPEGLLVDFAWLAARGYKSSLRAKYVAAGWLDQPTRCVYKRPRGQLEWQAVVISLQTLLARHLVVGGRMSLELQGYAHYLSAGHSEVHLHGPARPPTWLNNVPLREHFAYRNSVPLFGCDETEVLFPGLNSQPDQGDPVADRAFRDAGLRTLPWGQWNWPLTVSAPERAVLELLNELPNMESFHQTDMLMLGLSNLSPRRLQALLVRCQSVKVKRLFFFFADRHHHAWLKHLDRAAIDLGSGKRMLVEGGRFDRTYQITVPKELLPAQ
jgi:hypothetical protein